MSTEQVTSTLPLVGSKKLSVEAHPFAPLASREITASAQILKASWPESTDIHFKTITLLEPKKEEVIPFLAAERSGKKERSPERRSFVLYYIRNTVSYSV